MFFKHIFGVSVWLVLVIRSGIIMLYFHYILGNLLLDFDGKSLVHIKIKEKLNIHVSQISGISLGF